MAAPSKNVEWSQIPGNAVVIDMGRYYKVRFANGQEAVVYWGGHDAARAQATLKKWAAQSRDLLRVIRSFGKQKGRR